MELLNPGGVSAGWDYDLQLGSEPYTLNPKGFKTWV